MNLYLMRVCESEKGSDPGLSDVGKKTAAMMASFLKRQIGRVDIVISGPGAAAIETGEVMAAALGSYVATTTLLASDAHQETEKDLGRLWQQSGDVLLIVPDESFLEYWIAKREDDILSLDRGAVARTTDQCLQWLITPALIASTEELIEAARDLAESMPEPDVFTGRLTEAGKRIFVDEKGEYTYDEVEQKRLILGDGGQSGNCDYCEEAADRGWVDMDDVFEGPMGDEDEPPLHPHCTCEVEHKTRRVRVYT
jgi:phosphohistidine phosphatase SixA